MPLVAAAPRSAAPAALDPGTVRGGVIDALTREGVALAQVELRPAKTWAAAGAEPRIVSADTTGRFLIAGLPAGRYRVVASAPGFAPHATEVQVPASAPLELPLLRAGGVEGFVVLGDGAPARDAEVTIRGRGEPIVVRTGAGGGFASDLPSGTYRLSARLGTQAGELGGLVQVPPGQVVKGLRIGLGAEAAIAGRVVRTGARLPLGEVTVKVHASEDGAELGVARSDPSGAFRFEHLGPGTYAVCAAQADPLAPVCQDFIHLAAGQLATVELALGVTGSIEGRVRDSNGQGIAGAVVHGLVEPAVQTVSGADGHYLLSNVPAGWATVSARWPGADLGTTANTEVQEGQTATLDLTLEATSRIFGRVFGRDGALLPEPARVSAMPSAARETGLGGMSVGPGQSVGTMTDREGRYALVLPAGTSYSVYARVVAEQSPYASAGGTVLTLEPGEARELDLTVVDGRELRLTVLEPDGAPSIRPILSANSPGSGRRNFRGDEQGLTVIRLPVADEAVRIDARNGGRLGSVTVPAGQLEATLRLFASAALSGRVTAGGRQVEQFKVKVVLAESSFGLPFDDEGEFFGGEFTLDELPARPVLVHATTADGLSGTAQVDLSAPGAAPVEIALEGGGTIRARLVDADSGAAVAGFALLDHTSDPGETQPDGRIVFSTVAQGRHTLTVWTAGSEHVVREVTVEAGREADLGDVPIRAPKQRPRRPQTRLHASFAPGS